MATLDLNYQKNYYELILELLLFLLLLNNLSEWEIFLSLNSCPYLLKTCSSQMKMIVCLEEKIAIIFLPTWFRWEWEWIKSYKINCLKINKCWIYAEKFSRQNVNGQKRAKLLLFLVIFVFFFIVSLVMNQNFILLNFEKNEFCALWKLRQI